MQPFGGRRDVARKTCGVVYAQTSVATMRMCDGAAIRPAFVSIPVTARKARASQFGAPWYPPRWQIQLAVACAYRRSSSHIAMAASAAQTSKAAVAGKCVIAWFRADLRLRDNPMLMDAIRAGQGCVLPVYCFDPRCFGLTDEAKFPKCAAPRAQFLRECVEDLRNNLRALGSDLIVRHGHPEVVLTQLAEQYQCSHVFGSKEVAWEETRVEKKLRANMSKLEKPPKLSLTWGAVTMYHLDDLPMDIDQLPDVFSQFRRSVESRPAVEVRAPLLAPAKGALRPLPEGLEIGALPSMDELLEATIPEASQRQFQQDSRAVLSFRGGETAALARVQYYLWESDCVAKYKETRNGMVGGDYSSKFSAWLAHGCVSARDIYHEIKSYERTRVANDSTYWLIFELIWRDYFRLLALRCGNDIFFLGGPRRRDKIQWKQDRKAFEAWRTGNTGYPLVDANMRELNQTGFMSNRGRQNVASFLTKDLRIDWRWGAEWFESMLLDHDVHSNYGNWTYAAGVGMDPREDRHFNVVKQAKTYDETGEYAKLWLPELADVPAEFIYEPYKIPASERSRFNGLDQYPRPVVNTFGKGSFQAGGQGGRQPDIQSGKKHRGPSKPRANARREPKY
ncbi:Cryptochrome DASH, chloroplastic/mitochondrial [Porphyridium purpureum]|uniref:Cryptochrome DASH n=1 Tax=Porphyridium purpureum TaxID=35688 RepID=A0A5J4YSM7_PORPP|nr:Cryptochrome DASH, chloroplastic/mitochondrial [Porphyridium purpureum]|eukprot:POR7028..scf236_6